MRSPWKHHVFRTWQDLGRRTRGFLLAPENVEIQRLTIDFLWNSFTYPLTIKDGNGTIIVNVAFKEKQHLSKWQMFNCQVWLPKGTLPKSVAKRLKSASASKKRKQLQKSLKSAVTWTCGNIHVVLGLIQFFMWTWTVKAHIKIV